MPPSRKRLARTYTPVNRLDPVKDSYPSTSPSFIPSIHDIRYLQGLLANKRNFAKSGDSSCYVFEIDRQGVGSSVELDGDQTIIEYMEGVKDAAVSYRAIFCTFSEAEGTSFKQKLSLSRDCTIRLLESYNISPQFVPQLLGAPDHWAPGNFEEYAEQVNQYNLQFFCQHPRWFLHENESPLSVCMNHDTKRQCTTYLISSGDGSGICTKTKTRLYDQYCNSNSTVNEKESVATQAPDPFMLHLLITHESLEDGKPLFTKLRHRLYDVLDEVDDYAALPMHKRDNKSRRVLERATVNLHDVSQDIDSTIAAVDMSQTLTSLLVEAQGSYARVSASNLDLTTASNSGQQTRCALLYLSHSTASQRRWLTSYKSRKDIAMNLVFNLVTQQDAASSLTTALAAQADTSSMKAIAALTMVFLPATFVATLFGMGALLGATWQEYLAVTLPLTFAVLVVWLIWIRVERRTRVSEQKGYAQSILGGMIAYARGTRRTRNNPEEGVEMV